MAPNPYLPRRFRTAVRWVRTAEPPSAAVRHSAFAELETLRHRTIGAGGAYLGREIYPGVEKRRCASGSLTKEEVMNAETQQAVIQNEAVPLETGKWGPWLPVMEAPQPVLGAAYVSRQRAPRDIDVFVVAAG